MPADIRRADFLFGEHTFDIFIFSLEKSLHNKMLFCHPCGGNAFKNFMIYCEYLASIDQIHHGLAAALSNIELTIISKIPSENASIASSRRIPK